MYSEMIFVNGFVHCDPHPGNVLVRKRPDTGKAEIVLLDHGLYQVGEAVPTQPAQGLWACSGSELTPLPDRPHTWEADSQGGWRGPALPLELSFCASPIIRALSSQMRLVTPPSRAAVGSRRGCARVCAGALSAVSAVLPREAQVSPLGSKLPLAKLGLQGKGATQPQGGGNMQ